MLTSVVQNILKLLIVWYLYHPVLLISYWKFSRLSKLALPDHTVDLQVSEKFTSFFLNSPKYFLHFSPILFQNLNMWLNNCVQKKLAAIYYISEIHLVQMHKSQVSTERQQIPWSRIFS